MSYVGLESCSLLGSMPGQKPGSCAHIAVLVIDMNQMGASQGPTDRKFERLLLMFILVPHQVDPVLPGLEEQLEEEEGSDQRGRGCRRTDRELKIVLSSG